MNNNKKGKSFNIESICELMQNDDFRQIYEEERLVSEFTQALSDLMEEQDMNRAELAQILECSKSYISQLLNGNKNISLRNVAKVLYKLGKRMSIEVLDWENDLNLIGEEKKCAILKFEEPFDSAQYSFGNKWKQRHEKEATSYNSFTQSTFSQVS